MADRHRSARHAASVPSIASIDSPTSVTLSDGRTLDNIDAIVFATGYLGSLPSVLSPAVKARMAPSLGLVKPDSPSDGSESDGFLHLYRGILAASLPSVAIHVRGFAAGESFQIQGFAGSGADIWACF